MVLFQKKRSDRSSASVSTISSSSSRASSVDEEKGNIHRKSKSSYRIPTIEEDIVFDLVLDVPPPSNVTNVYSEERLWGAERAPTITFETVPKLDLTGIESDSSESSVEAQFASRFESEFSLPILQSIIPMDVTEAEHLSSHVDMQPQANPLYSKSPTSSSSSTDASLSQESSDDGDFSDRHSLESIEMSAFEFEHPSTSMPAITIEALPPKPSRPFSFDNGQAELKAPPKASSTLQSTTTHIIDAATQKSPPVEDRHLIKQGSKLNHQHAAGKKALLSSVPRAGSR